MTCPACGFAGAALVTNVDHGRGSITIDALHAARFYAGQRVTITARRSQLRRFLDAWRAARMAWSRP